MAIKVGGTTVIDDSRNVDNIGTIKGLTYPSADGTTGQFLKTDGAGNLSFQTVQTDPTIATLTKSFANGESASLSLSSAISTAPVVSVIKEVPQTGVSSKGTWDVAADGANYERHDTAYDTTLTPSLEGWDISTASFVQRFSFTGGQVGPYDCFFKPDGTIMYIVSTGGVKFGQYSLTTPWDISTASYVKTFSISGQDTTPEDVFFKPDGSKFYILGNAGNDVNEYSLTADWDIATASYVQNFSVSNQETNPKGLFFKPEGDKMYVIGNGADNVDEYDLTTDWDISSASYLQSFSVNAEESTPNGIFFKPNGLSMFIVGQNGDDVNEYILSSAWDVSTASYNQNFSVASQGNQPQGIFFKTDGEKMYIVDYSQDEVNEYDLDLSNVLVLGTGSFSSSDVGKTIEGNGGKAVLTSASGSYYEATAFTDSSTISSGDWGMFGTVVNVTDGLKLSAAIQNFQPVSDLVYDNVSLEMETLPSLSPSFPSAQSGITFNPDGTRFYTTNYNSDYIYQVDLSTAYDLSTATFAGSEPSGASQPWDGVYFNEDGTEVYFLDAGDNRVQAWILSTAYDITEKTFIGEFTVPDYSSLTGFFVKPDGKKAFFLSNVGDNVCEVSLSTAFDFSTMIAVQTFSINATSPNPNGIHFDSTGTRLYTTDSTDFVYEWTLSNPWDISTISLRSSFDVTQDADISAVFVSHDGSKLFVSDTGAGGMIYQFTMGSVTAATGTYQVSVTNAGGQIDSEYWTDINTMTADQDVGDGEVYYAVSTDNRTTWSVIKEGTGVRPIARNNSGTWQYNSDTGNPDAWDVSEATFIRDLNTTPSDQGQAVFFKPDGTQYYVVEKDNARVYKHSLSTPWDISTASSFEALFYVGSQEGSPTGLFFKPDGKKMYITGHGGGRAYEYDLSTDWDITSSSFNQSYSMSELSQPSSIIFKPDGTQFYVNNNNGYVYSYTLSTPWDVSSSDFNNNKNTSTGTNEGNPRGLFFKSNGTKMYSLGFQRDTINEWDLSAAWDVSTATLNTNTLATGGTSGTGLFFNEDGDRLYTIDEGTDRIRQYSIGVFAYSTTAVWANANTNQELPALQEALDASLANRMNKTQLDAVTDPNHYTLGDTLDLMIGLYQGTASDNVPSSDGVSINYDAEVLNQGAVMGTDYDIDVPDSSTVRVTSNATQNLKIRVV